MKLLSWPLPLPKHQISATHERDDRCPMKIVAWNCNMGFHKKYETLLALDPDVAIIPECANIDFLKQSATDFKSTSAIWIGDNPRKGLGVFAFGQFSAALADCYKDQLCPFIAPITIDGRLFGLFGLSHKTLSLKSPATIHGFD
jgi:hypothetical protein